MGVSSESSCCSGLRSDIVNGTPSFGVCPELSLAKRGIRRGRECSSENADRGSMHTFSPAIGAPLEQRSTVSQEINSVDNVEGQRTPKEPQSKENGCNSQTPEDAVSSECPWCAGVGIDGMTGEPCSGCREVGSPKRHRRRVDAERQTVNLRGFLSTVVALEKPVFRKIPEFDRRDGAATAVTFSPPGRRRTSRVKFDHDDVIEYPITPYSEVYGMHPRYFQPDVCNTSSCEDSSEDDPEEN